MWNIPNLLSLSRIPLAAILFVCIEQTQWLLGLIVFIVAMLTDWLDGWWARKFHQLSPLGRSLDPLTDKVLIVGTFIFLIPVTGTFLNSWIVTIIVSRELIVTGLRGMVEATGQTFGADWFGKLKTVLQSAAIIGILFVLTVKQNDWFSEWIQPFDAIVEVLVYAMLFATVGSFLQYLGKAVKMLR